MERKEASFLAFGEAVVEDAVESELARIWRKNTKYMANILYSGIVGMLDDRPPIIVPTDENVRTSAWKVKKSP